LKGIATTMSQTETHPAELGAVDANDVYEQEKAHFTRLLADNPREAYRRFGLALFYSIDDEALVRERLSLDFEPRDALDHYNLGVIESHAGNHREALAHYRKAMAAGTDLPELYYNLALTYRELGETREARKNFQRYLAIVEEWKDEWDQDELESVEEVREYLEGN